MIFQCLFFTSLLLDYNGENPKRFIRISEEVYEEEVLQV